MEVTTFFSSFLKQVDGKGRVSIPAPFREVLDRLGSPNQIFAVPSSDLPAIDCGGIELMEMWSDRLAQSPERTIEHHVAQLTLNSMSKLQLDPEGRVLMPAEMMKRIGAGNSILLTGSGHVFQIWDPQSHEAHQNSVLERALAAGVTFPPPARRLPR